MARIRGPLQNVHLAQGDPSCAYPSGCLHDIRAGPGMRPFGLDDARPLGAGVALGERLAGRAPGLGAALDTDHVLEPLLTQELRGPQGAEATLADQVDRAA